MDALSGEKDNRRTAIEQERAAHQVTREQLVKAEVRGDAAVAVAGVDAVDQLGHHVVQVACHR